MQRIDIDKISRDVAAGRGDEYRRPPTVIRVPLWLIAAAALTVLLAVLALAAHV